MTKYVDPPAEKIAEQQRLIDEIVARTPGMADTTKIKAWSKWCASYEYRKREWEWRQKYFANRE